MKTFTLEELQDEMPIGWYVQPGAGGSYDICLTGLTSQEVLNIAYILNKFKDEYGE